MNNYANMKLKRIAYFYPLIRNAHTLNQSRRMDGGVGAPVSAAAPASTTPASAAPTSTTPASAPVAEADAPIHATAGDFEAAPAPSPASVTTENVENNNEDNDNDDDDNDNDNNDGTVSLSKKQQRRLARSESFAASKLARRQAERERRKAKRHLSAQALATARAEAAGEATVDTSREALAALGWLEQIPPRNDEEEAELLSRPAGTQGALPDLFFKFKHRNTDDRMRQLLARPNLLEVVIDCGYESVMTAKEISSLETQLAHAYGANCRALRPALLTVTGLAAASATRAALVKARTSIDGWHWRACEGALEDVYPEGSADRGRLVYLCAEAEDEVVWPGEQSKGEGGASKGGVSVSAAAYVAAADAPRPLEEEDTSKGTVESTAAGDAAAAVGAAAGASSSAVAAPTSRSSSFPTRPIFVLGGLVDHNRLPGAGLARAQKLGLPVARFPLDRYVSAKERVRGVLTTVGAFELLLAKQGMEWGEAVEAAMPKRWVRPTAPTPTASAPAPASTTAAAPAAAAAAATKAEVEAAPGGDNAA